METITISINNEDGRKIIRELQEKKLVTVIDTPDLNSLVFPGEPVSEEEFKTWIALREEGESMSLAEAKAKWAEKEKQLFNHGK